jgi:LysM repeat protein
VQAAFLVSATFTGRSPLGSPATTQVKRLLPYAAAPAAVAGLAAAFAFGNGHAASPEVADVAAHQSAATTATPQVGASAEHLVSITRHPATGLPVARVDATRLAAIEPKGKHHRTLPAKYVVKSGDTLASIAQQLYDSPAYWPALYAANHSAIPNADDIQAGQVLAVPAKPAKVPSPPAAPAPAPVQPASTAGSGQSDQSASTAQTAPVQTVSTYTASSGSFQACVIAAESGGNAQVMNASGHYGLYQFSASTWAEYGGNPADFGDASVAEQNQVFDNAIAAGGESNWAPYDGC